jgi:hypothetical protein
MQLTQGGASQIFIHRHYWRYLTLDILKPGRPFCQVLQIVRIEVVSDDLYLSHT